MELAETGKAEELHANLRKKAVNSLYFFSKVVLGYADLEPGFHLPFCEHIKETIPQQKRMYLLPRGHFKSTIVSKSYPLWRLAGGGLNLMARPPKDPRDLRFFMVGESSTVAEKNLRDVKNNLLHNPLLRWLFPELIPIKGQKWSDSEILLPRSHSFDESTFTADGVGAKRTGFHFDVIIYDDMVGEKAAKSVAEMNSAITWFKAAPGLLNDQETGEETFIGTRWKHGTADIYGWAMENEPRFKTNVYIRAAVERDESGEEQIAFPERFTWESLEAIRKRQGDYLYSCQYHNNPTHPEGADFPPNWIKYYTVEDDHKSITPTDGTPKTSLEQLVRISFYDVSSGGSTAKAENAIVVIGEDHLRRIFVLSTWSKNCSIGLAVEKWHVLNDRFRCWKNAYEQVGAQKAVEDVVLERTAQITCRICKKVHKRLRPQPWKPPGGRIKEERIRLFAQAPFEEGRVYFRNGMTELRRQVVSFPHGDLVDLFDALATAISLSRAPMSEEQVKEERDKLEHHRMAAKPRTHTTRDYGGYA